MGRRLILFLIASLLLSLAGCTQPSPDYRSPQGLGEVSLATVGSEGGSISSPDGRLTIAIPPGALASETVLMLSSSSIAAGGNLGPAYEASPEGLLFTLPVTVIYRFDSTLIGATPPQSLMVATLANGTWSPLGTGGVDLDSLSAWGLTTHFSVFGLTSAVVDLDPAPDAAPDAGRDTGADPEPRPDQGIDLPADVPPDRGDLAPPDTVDEPCIEAAGGLLVDFGPRLVGEEHTKRVVLANCSTSATLIIDSIALTTHAELFGLDRFSLGGLPESDDPIEVEPGEQIEILLLYSPIEYTSATHPDLCPDDPCQVTDGAMLGITSNAPDQSPLSIEVRGSGTDNRCPVAIIRATDDLEEEPTEGDLIAAIGATIYLDGQESYDLDGAVELYRWELSEKPPGSTAVLSSTEGAQSSFVSDLLGIYYINLAVIDNEGLTSCEPATIRVSTLGEQAQIHIVLTWDTEGTDLDLHLLHPNASVWNTSPWDCFYANRNPNWGTSVHDDDPNLEVDDVDGYGPEQISFSYPEGTTSDPATYRVGVFYYSDHGRGPSSPTVKIFIDGIERFSSTMPDMADRQFWDVARITWPSQDIERIHVLYPSGYPPI
ncbi:MAG: hypothetical protein JW797_13025 [Bradymonadales bacterium]|nr:hypothetical protein [Bradymonadales bacterium]